MIYSIFKFGFHHESIDTVHAKVFHGTEDERYTQAIQYIADQGVMLFPQDYEQFCAFVADNDLSGAFDSLTVALSDDIWIAMDDVMVDEGSNTVAIYDPAGYEFAVDK